MSCPLMSTSYVLRQDLSLNLERTDWQAPGSLRSLVSPVMELLHVVGMHTTALSCSFILLGNQTQVLMVAQQMFYSESSPYCRSQDCQGYRSILETRTDLCC